MTLPARPTGKPMTKAELAQAMNVPVELLKPVTDIRLHDDGFITFEAPFPWGDEEKVLDSLPAAA